MNFFDFADRLEDYSAQDFLDDLQLEIEENPYVKALQIQQWNEGKDSDGNILGIYSISTEIITDGRKKAGETYDLFDTGQTRRNLQIIGIQTGGDITWYYDSDAPAVPELLEKLGGRIFGLQQKNIGQFTGIAQDIGIDILNKKLNL